MPSFCRHGRFEASCPICSMKAKKQAAAAPTRSARTPRQPSMAGSRTRSRRTPSDVSVRRLVRAADDGYEHELVPGLHASEDARRLAADLGFAAARLDQLRDDPPGLYADVVLASDPLEAAWLAFLIAVLSPLQADDPWSAIAVVRTDFASGEIRDVADAGRGPRAAPDPAAALTAFRGWLARPDALVAEASLPAARRFDRLYERLGLPGLARAQRYEFLVLASRLGVGDIEAPSLRLGEVGDETTLAAKRVFAIGDAVLLGQRAAALAAAVDVPIAALDLGLVRWSASEPITAGATVDGADRAEAIAAVLGVATPTVDADDADDAARPAPDADGADLRT